MKPNEHYQVGLFATLRNSPLKVTKYMQEEITNELRLIKAQLNLLNKEMTMHSLFHF